MRNRPLAARIAVVAVVGGCAVVLSGCEEVLLATFGKRDPPVHMPSSPGRAVPAAHISAAAGRAFSGKANGKLASRIQLKHGFVKSKMGPGRFTGKFSGTLPGAAQAGDELLTPFTKSDWRAQFTAILDRRTKKITMSGLILADYTNSTTGTAVPGRACLRLSYRNARKGKRFVRNRGRSTVKVLGGEGDAATLVGSAVVRVRQTTGDNFRMSGRAKVRRGAARGVNSACKKLERKFKLTPLP